VSVVAPEPNPETVAALLDTTWRLTDCEAARTDALDRKAATIATFASLLSALTATVGLGFVNTLETWWAFALFASGIAALTGSLFCAVRMLWPREYITLGTSYIERFTVWGEILKPPAQVRGDTMRTLVAGIARERDVNDRKTTWLRVSLVLLVAGLTLISLEGVILGIERVRW
jgi:hypothetical protein